MNIEQKNTLFVVTLVMLVLASVATLGYFLISRHIYQQTTADLRRAHSVYVEAQKQGFEALEARARRVSTDSSLLAAMLTGDLPTIKGVLRSLAVNSDAGLLAVYRIGGGASGVSDKHHLSSPQVLSSPLLRRLVRSAEQQGHTTFGHALILDSLMRLVAVPIRSPLGGNIGVLLLGKEITPGGVARMRELVRADVVLYQSNVIYGSTLGNLDQSPDSLSQSADGLVHFNVDGQPYYGRIFPILDRPGGETQANVLLASPTSAQWDTYRALWRKGVYFSALILLSAALLGIWISRRWLTKPLKTLVRVTTAIGKGDLDLDVSINAKRKDELGELAASFNDMLKRLKASQAEEMLSRQRFHDFADSTSDWLWETDHLGQFSYVSQNVVATLAMPAEDLVGRTFSHAFPQDNMREITLLLQPIQGETRPLKDVEIWVTNRDGIRLCLRLNGMPYGKEGEFRGFRGTARDITKVKNDEERLIQLANRDHLTGLSNRRRFMEDLSREVAIAARQGQSGALLLIDLDHFKLVNDTAGHAAGDEVVVQVGGMLRRLSRNVDLVARLSGDEFVIALINTTPAQASRRAGEILKQLSQLHPTYGGRILNTTASIGIVIYPEHGSSPNELLAKADTAMYAAKRDGRNRAHLYSERDMAQQLMGSQLTWKERIHDALEHDLFQLVYQPIVATGTQPVNRYEVLVRLPAADGALHTPGSFIPTAEQFGLIHQVDSVVVRKALRALATLQPVDPPVVFSINLSGLSVGDTAMMKLIKRELDATAVRRDRIVFEITESAACQDINRAIDFIGQIRRMGCRVALDDFGVGFSSFSYLKHLKVDIIKIDGSFIRDIQNSKEDQLFVKALVYVAKGMGMQTVAEFVETEECLTMVRRLGVDYAQGYHIGKPQSHIDVRPRVPTAARS